jgi:hypothetical protein
MLEVFALRFDRIGSLYPILDNPGEVLVGSLITPPFYKHGRADYPLDRGPFGSVRAYFEACAQREVDSARLASTPRYVQQQSSSLTSSSYLRDLANAEAQRSNQRSEEQSSPSVPRSSVEYQRVVEEERVNVERSMSLFARLIDRCEGLDELDPDMAPFSLDIHGLSLRDVTVSPTDSSQIVCFFISVASIY